MIELDWLKQWSMYSPEKMAVKDGETGHSYTYSELFHLSRKGASLLRTKYNIQKGSRVAVLATNELETVFLFFSLLRLGALLVPINFRLTQREVNYIVSDCQPDLIYYQDGFSSIIENLEFKTKTCLLTGDQSFSDELFSSPTTEDSVFFDGLLQDPVMILYTSGTTGFPKGALISHEMMFWNSINTTMSLNLTQNDSAVIFLPFFHTGGWNVLTTPLLSRGASVVFIKKFDPTLVLKLTVQENCTLIFGVPTTMDMMSRTELFTHLQFPSVRYAIVGGEPMPLGLIQQWESKQVPIRQGYGLTEFGPNVFSLNEKDSIRKMGSIGFPNFYVKAKVAGENDEELGPNQVGELWLKGPMAMAGYWKNPKATQETIQDGWLRTGDLVRRDEEGYYYVIGRKKDMYISGGENVYPVELEQVLRQVPGVKEVAVIGVPDEKWGEVGKAFVVSERPTLQAQDLLKYCQENLAKFKIPKYFVFMDQLPKGESGKILKRELRS